MSTDAMISWALNFFVASHAHHTGHVSAYCATYGADLITNLDLSAAFCLTLGAVLGSDEGLNQNLIRVDLFI